VPLTPLPERARLMSQPSCCMERSRHVTRRTTQGEGRSRELR
jgi:hypothetical protein